MDQSIADRRALRRKLSFWRVFAAVIAIAAVVGMWLGFDKGLRTGSDHIARISIGGLIQDDDELTARLKRIAESKAVKALIVDISSPGGTTFGGETIYKAIREVASQKPVVSNIRTLAASAGYMIALGGDEIVAGETSITGSIGVIFQYPQAQELMDKIGISMEEIKSSPMKAEPSPFHPPSEETKQMIDAMVRDSYDWFVDLVADRRGMNRSQALRLSDGSIFTGRQALENGLVDQLGGLDEIKAYLKEKDVNAELPVLDWKASEGIVSDLSFALGRYAGFGEDSQFFYGQAVKKLVGEKLFLDGLLSVWQVGAE